MCNLPAESFEFVKRVEQEPTYRTTYYDTTSPLKSIVSRSVPLPRRPHPAAAHLRYNMSTIEYDTPSLETSL